MRFNRIDWHARAARWRWRFALFPIVIHDKRIWLEWYRYKGDSYLWYRDFKENAGKENDADFFYGSIY